MLMDIERIANDASKKQGGRREQVEIIKGAVNGILKSTNPRVNEAED